MEEIQMFDIRIKISVIGFVIFMLPMLINIVYAIFPPVNATETTQKVNKILELTEHSTRIFYAVAMCIIVSNQKINYKRIGYYFSA